MSKAYKCDRCGAFFEREDMWHKLKGERPNQLPICTKEYDLCDACQAELELFLTGAKVNIAVNIDVKPMPKTVEDVVESFKKAEKAAKVKRITQ